MKKAFFIAAAAAMLFASCGNNNTKTNNQQTQNEPVVEEPAVEEPAVEEPAAPETTTWDHYDWSMTLPNDGWKVSNAYSEMGIEELSDWSSFNVKDWTKTTIEKCTASNPAENRLEDITVGDYTWTVFSNVGRYKVACYTFDPEREMVVRIGSENIEDLSDPRFVKVLEGFGFNK